jgi:hypothetical protein
MLMVASWLSSSGSPAGRALARRSWLMHDGEQPGPDVSAVAPRVQLIERSYQAVVDKVVGILPIAQQGGRIAPQRWNAGLDAGQNCHGPKEKLLHIGRDFSGARSRTLQAARYSATVSGVM